MSWADTTLTTTTTLTRHELEITEDTNAVNISNKITLGKAILKNQIEKYLRQNNYTCDYEDGEELIDIVANPSTFTVACDYKVLELIYKDLSSGKQDTIYWDKMLLYRDDFENEIATALTRIDLDLDQDGETDEYQTRISTVGYCNR